MRISHVLLAAALATGAPLPADAAGPADEIRAASAAWDEAFNAGDLDALMDRYHDNAVSMPPGFPSSAGRASIRGDFEGFFAGNAARHATDIQDILVRDDVAIERARYTMEITPEGGDTVTERGKHIVVYRRGEDGTWRVLWEIWNQGQ